jgi:putative flippase GtrA
MQKQKAEALEWPKYLDCSIFPFSVKDIQIVMNWFLQIKKYATVGVGSALTDFAIYGALIHYANYSPEVANLISRPCGGLFSFTFNKIWTFDRKQLSGTHHEIMRFGVVWAASYCLSILLVWVFHQYFIRDQSLPLALAGMIQHMTGWDVHLVEVLSKLCAESLVCIGIFLSHRFWTFRHH